VTVSQKLLWNLYAGAIAAGTAVAAAKAVEGAWRLATGEEPPEPNDPATPLRQALIWAVASALGIGLAQLLTNRLAAQTWVRATGSPAPRFGKVSLRI